MYDDSKCDYIGLIMIPILFLWEGIMISFVVGCVMSFIIVVLTAIMSAVLIVRVFLL